MESDGAPPFGMCGMADSREYTLTCYPVEFIRSRSNGRCIITEIRLKK